MAPQTPQPMEVAQTVRTRSFMAMGMTPSEIMQRPMGKATLMFSTSSLLKMGLWNHLEKSHARVTPKGGTMAASTLMPSGSMMPSASRPSQMRLGTLEMAPP